MKKYLFILLAASFGWSQTPIFVLCEGNFSQGNATLWQFSDSALQPYEGNPLGDTGQSMLAEDDRLYVILNGSGVIKVFQIGDQQSDLNLIATVNTNFSGPRNMAILNGKGYVTQWYTGNVAVLNLATLEFTSEIPVAGMPEDIVTDGTSLYVSITMNADWSSANLVQVIDPVSESVSDTWEVGSGPGDILLNDQTLYIARTYYDVSWNAFAGTSKVDLVTGQITITDYGSTTSFGADLAILDGTVYRTFGTGIAPLDDNLNIIPEGQLGDLNGIYSMAVIADHIYFGVTDDFLAPDQIVVSDLQGNTEGIYETGAIPGSFASLPVSLGPACDPAGDVNADTQLDILDIVMIIDYILNAANLSDAQVCTADFDSDGSIDVSDIIGWISVIIS